MQAWLLERFPTPYSLVVRQRIAVVVTSWVSLHLSARASEAGSPSLLTITGHQFLSSFLLGSGGLFLKDKEIASTQTLCEEYREVESEVRSKAAKPLGPIRQRHATHFPAFLAKQQHM
jgi:hypothetical protein